MGTIFLIFCFQGEAIVDRPLHVLMLAVPLSIQSYAIFAVAYGLFYWFKVPFKFAAPGSLIATSNFFELALAMAMSLFGPESGATLTTVVGALEEVPIMLSLVWFANRTQHWFDFAPEGEDVSMKSGDQASSAVKAETGSADKEEASIQKLLVITRV